MKLHEFIITAIVMWIVAWLFVQGWDRQEFVDQAKRAARMESMLYPEPQSTYYPQPTDLAQPKKKVFQDASQPKGVK